MTLHVLHKKHIVSKKFPQSSFSGQTRCACSAICPRALPGWPRGRAGTRARFQREGPAGHVVKGTEVESPPLRGSSVCGGPWGVGREGEGGGPLRMKDRE